MKNWKAHFRSKFGADSGYGAALAAVGLHPDNPDGMYAGLMAYLQDPQGYKVRQPEWRGPRDAKVWYEGPSGTANLMWPYHSGAWNDAAPKNDAQLRATFKIPSNVSTAQFLSALWGFPKGYTYKVDPEGWSYSGGGFDLGNALQQGVGALVSVANVLNIPGVNIQTALLTGQNPIDALKQDVSNFAASANIAKHVVSGDTSGLTADLNKTAAAFGVKLNSGDVSAAVSIAQSGGDPDTIASVAMGQGYKDAWNAATSSGSVHDPSLPTPKGARVIANAIPAAHAYPPKHLALSLGKVATPSPAPSPHGVTIAAKKKEKGGWWKWTLGALGVAAAGVGAVKFAGHHHHK